MFSFELHYQIPPRYFFVTLKYDKNIEEAKDEFQEHSTNIRNLMHDRKILMKGDYKDNSGKLAFPLHQ